MAELIDAYGRHLNYVRISVTDRCNFRCTYCMPPEGVKCLAHDDIMRYEEISLLCGALWDLGVRKFRFTGGEPLVRKDLVQFLARLNTQLPGVKIALTTNGALLEQYAEELAKLKLHSLNISLDTLDAGKFASITRLGDINIVMRGIKAALKAKIRYIKLNTVLIRGFNDNEIADLLRFSRNEGLTLRLIEFMPLEDGVWDKSSFISGDEILRMLPNAGFWVLDKRRMSIDGPANYYVNEKSGDTIGIITAVSNHFCPNCNRLRVSASGNLRLCLFSPSEIPLRPMLLNRDTDALKRVILDNIADKPRCWDDIRTGQLHMSGIGG